MTYSHLFYPQQLILYVLFLLRMLQHLRSCLESHSEEPATKNLTVVMPKNTDSSAAPLHQNDTEPPFFKQLLRVVSRSFHISHFKIICTPARVWLVMVLILSATLLTPRNANAQVTVVSEPLAERCFAVSDETNRDNADSLIEVNLESGEITPLQKIAGARNIEAIALVPQGNSGEFIIYAANKDVFGYITIAPTQFVPIGKFSAKREANGPAGRQTLNDIDGLTYDSVNDVMYAVHRRFDKPDLLFQVDINTGRHVDNVYNGDDYVVVTAIDGLHDVDDIAIHPDPDIHTMYAVINARGAGGILGILNPETGEIKENETFEIYDRNGNIVDDIEGIAFSSEQKLYGTTGEHGPDGPDSNQLFYISLGGENLDMEKGRAKSVARFDKSADDVEGLGCLTRGDLGTPDPIIRVQKSTNGLDADEPSADPTLVPQLAMGCPVEWTYEVSNIGLIPVTGVKLVDDKLGEIQCPRDMLGSGDSMTCSAPLGVATEANYQNIATATAISVTLPIPRIVTATDPSHYNAFPTSIQIEKSTNGIDADTAAEGPVLAIGNPVTWEYVITNTGETTLTNWSLTDDQLSADEISCPVDALSLAPGQSITCFANDSAVAGPHRNLATVTARSTLDPSGACPVTDTDLSHYSGVGQPGIGVEKLTSGCGAEVPTNGPELVAEWPVMWTYRVVNTGEMPLSEIELVDDQLGPISCPSSTLDIRAEMTCTAMGTAQVGPYSNTATVTATSAGGPVSAGDASSYTGLLSSVSIEKSTNGQDADIEPGPMIAEGAPVTWNYLVTNNGDVTLTDVRVIDDQLAADDVDCGGVQSLASGATMTCTATGTAVAGQYQNVASVLARPDVPGGAACLADSSDPSHYEGAGDLDVDQVSALGWSYTVTNTGEVLLENIVVDAGSDVEIDCKNDSLAPSEGMPCSVIGPESHFENLAKVTAIEATNKTTVSTSVLSTPIDGLSITVEPYDMFLPSPDIPAISSDTLIPWSFTVANQRDDFTIDRISAEIIDLSTGLAQPLDCPRTLLAPSDSMSCGINSVASLGLNQGIVTVVGGILGTEQPLYADTVWMVEGFEAASVSGRVFVDEVNIFGSANGLQDAGEPSLFHEGLQVVLHPVDGSESMTTTIEKDGTYRFDALEPGDYSISAERPNATDVELQGFVWSAANRINDRIDSDVAFEWGDRQNIAYSDYFRLSSGENADAWDIGFEQVTFAGSIYIAENDNERRDPSEHGLSGATISLESTSPSGQAPQIIESSDRGTFEFAAVTPGTYRITATDSRYPLIRRVFGPDTTGITFEARSSILSPSIYLPIFAQDVSQIVNAKVGEGGK